MILRFIFGIALLLTFTSSYSQSAIDSTQKYHSPHKATIYSAILPGGGQIYNKKYWKIPIIYAGFVGLGYLAITNNDEYKIYKE